jgi:beta-lactamase regulating signal transducer with metallopeptidase domain
VRHEIAHVRQGDLRLSLLQRMIEDVLWWNPFVTWLGRVLREHRELCCDEAAASSDRRDRAAYARLLLTAASANAHGLGLNNRGGETARRILRLSSIARPPSAMAAVLLWSCLVGAAIISIRTADAGATYVGLGG